MKKLFSIMLPLLILSFFTGCVYVEELVRKAKSQPAEPKADEVPEKKIIFDSRAYRQKALEYEKQDELQLSLIHMNIAHKLSPDDNEISEKIAYLRTEIDQKANQHFNEGLKFYKKKRFKFAREQFVMALTTKPDHKKALDYLKDRLPDKGYKEYRVRKNDTLRDISNKFYKDPGKDFLIAYLNDLKANEPLVPGTRLKIVTLGKKMTKPPFNMDKELTDAKTLLEKKAYGDVLRIAEKILEHDRLNQEAKDLRSAVYYQMGIRLSNQGKYVEAINTFKKADPQYEGIEEAIQKTTDKELKKAERLLKEKQYKQAVDATQNILNHDPSNKAARDLINTTYCQMGRDFITQKDYVQALDVLSRADTEHGCVKKALSDVKQISRKQAEVHYLRGVKHFLNEELTDAIKEWEMTLALDPDYKKAKESIKKTRDLLEKLKQVE
ncbi:MAG: LysM peptidoglycan-binding domain-containing protein [Deltaproteobacteria bacterium]|nr:LysM peptidoglycan-binding domain-containing protein [Deltaproteobacteria bacterium]